MPTAAFDFATHLTDSCCVCALWHIVVQRRLRPTGELLEVVTGILSRMDCTLALVLYSSKVLHLLFLFLCVACCSSLSNDHAACLSL